MLHKHLSHDQIPLMLPFLLSRAGFLLYLVERAKKCLDFAATLYIIHLFICIIYGGWPSSITWWVVNLSSLALMSLLGEWLCIRRELREIPITRLRASKLIFCFLLFGSCFFTSTYLLVVYGLCMFTCSIRLKDYSCKAALHMLFVVQNCIVLFT